MNMIHKEPERHEIEALLPWHAAGTLNRRDADRVERAIAGDHELARRFDLVREELAETIHLNETLGAPSARAMERLFSAIDNEEVRAPVRRRSFDLAGRISELLSSFSPRTLAWGASAAAVVLLLQAGVIAGVVIKDQSGSGSIDLASAGRPGTQAQVRFAPQATATDINNFLGAYRVKVVEGPLSGGMYRIQFSEPPAEVSKIVQQMQQETRVVHMIATVEERR